VIAAFPPLARAVTELSTVKVHMLHTQYAPLNLPLRADGSSVRSALTVYGGSHRHESLSHSFHFSWRNALLITQANFPCASCRKAKAAKFELMMIHKSALPISEVKCDEPEMWAANGASDRSSGQCPKDVDPSRSSDQSVGNNRQTPTICIQYTS
jgi:hypothetical protein